MGRLLGPVLILVTLAGVTCMPYTSAPRRETIVRVALECGVDGVKLNGRRDRNKDGDHVVTLSDPLPLRVEPVDGRVLVNGRPFRGRIEVRKIDGRLWIINVVDIESYLMGVVPCEIGGVSEKQFEAAKAQAVAARTYARAHMGQYRDLGFDLYATVQDQVYKGIAAEREITSKAVARTAGQVLVYGNAPVEAKYHSTCGGRTADFNDAWAGQAPPYLRSVACSYCEKSPHYRWQKVMTKGAFFTHLRRRMAKIGIVLSDGELIESFRLRRSARSLRLSELIIVTGRAEYRVPSYRIRTLFGEPTDPGGLLKSTCVYLKTKGDQMTIEGRGYGHGVGMCQFGALEMAARGKDYKQILSHYYPGTRLRRVR